MHGKKPQAFCFFFHFFYSLWFCFWFPPEKSETQVTGHLTICLLGLYFEDVSVMYLRVVQLPQQVWSWTPGAGRSSEPSLLCRRQQCPRLPLLPLL